MTAAPPPAAAEIDPALDTMERTMAGEPDVTPAPKLGPIHELGIIMVELLSAKHGPEAALAFAKRITVGTRPGARPRHAARAWAQLTRNLVAASEG